MVSSRLRLSPLPTIGGVASALVVAATFASLPGPLLESLVELAGIPAMLPAAQPPLGVTARLLLAVCGGLFVGATAWAALYLLFGPSGPFAKAGGTDGLPQVRVADAHPDAPPRKPFSAADFGVAEPTPPQLQPAPAPPPVEQPLPRDLDQPLASFDPAAIPDEPKQPVRPVAPIAPRPAKLAPGERIESFELSPRHAEEAGAPSIEALLERLEQGTLRRQELRSAG